MEFALVLVTIKCINVQYNTTDSPYKIHHNISNVSIKRSFLLCIWLTISSSFFLFNMNTRYLWRWTSIVAHISQGVVSNLIGKLAARDQTLANILFIFFFGWLFVSLWVAKIKGKCHWIGKLLAPVWIAR